MRKALVGIGILALCSSCLQHPGNIPEQQQAFYVQAEQLLHGGKYNQAFDAFKDFNTHYPSSTLADNALFMAGFIQVCKGNAQRNYTIAQKLFTDLEERYTESEWLEEAQSWNIMLQKIASQKNNKPVAPPVNKVISQSNSDKLERAIVVLQKKLAEIKNEQIMIKQENEKLKKVLHKLEVLDR